MRDERPARQNFPKKSAPSAQALARRPDPANSNTAR